MAKPITPTKSKRGGVRPNSGRKPKAFTLLKRRIETERVEDAEYAFALLASVMRDANQDIERRLGCAEKIMDRVLGKPKTLTEITGANGDPLLIRLDK